MPDPTANDPLVVGSGSGLREPVEGMPLVVPECVEQACRCAALGLVLARLRVISKLPLRNEAVS